MPVTTDCLAGLVGLSRAGSSCFPLPTVTPPATNDGITASLVGMYVDEVEGLSLRNAPTAAAGPDVYQRLDRARNQALLTVAHRLGSRLSSDKPRYAVGGLLGGLGNGSYDPVNLRAVLRLPTQLREGGALRLDSIVLYTDTVAEDVAVLLDGVEVATITTNGGPTALTGVLVPLDGQVHELTAVLPDGVRVRANATTCGCGNDFVRAMRLNLTDVRARAGGFAVQVSEVCTLDTPLCYALGKDEELQRSVGFAIQYLSAANFAASLLTDAHYNRYTMLEPKQLDALGSLWTGRAQEHLTWLLSPSGLARVVHPCYVCAPAAWHPTKVFTH